MDLWKKHGAFSFVSMLFFPLCVKSCPTMLVAKLDYWDFQAISFSNLYAPEHLIINVQDAEKWEGFIENAGILLLVHLY